VPAAQLLALVAPVTFTKLPAGAGLQEVWPGKS
jgi:hypothetical protein